MYVHQYVYTYVCIYVCMYVCMCVSTLLLLYPQCVHLDSKLENMIETLRSEVSANQEVEKGATSKKVRCMLCTAACGMQYSRPENGSLQAHDAVGVQHRHRISRSGP